MGKVYSMTIKYLDSKRISALAADTKPTNVETNSILVEKDTGKRYWYDGSAWTRDLPILPTVSGLKVHFDTTDTTTITKDGSNLVSQWDDLSGQANHISQATSSKQPLFVDNVHNKSPIIRFDGVDDSLFRTTFSGGQLGQPNTIFIVCTTQTGWILGGGTSDKNNAFLVSGGVYKLYANPSVGSVSNNSTFAQYTLSFNTTSSTLRRNKSDLQTGMNVGVEPFQGIALASVYGTQGYANVDIAEVLVYDNVISVSDRNLVEDYLATKWGL